MHWKVQKITTPAAHIKVVDAHGHSRTLVVRSGEELVLDLDESAGEEAPDTKPAAKAPGAEKATTKKVDDKPKAKKTDEAGAKKARKARKSPKNGKAQKKSAKSATALEWRDDELDSIKGKTAAYGEGHWVVARGKAFHVLLFVWPDGTVRDVDAGTRRYAMDVAQFYVDHGVAGHTSLDAFLAALKEKESGMRPSRRDFSLTWSSEQKGDIKKYKAVVPELGRMWIEQIAPRSEYVVLWKPRGGGQLQVTQVKRLGEAKTAALQHARKVVGLAGDRKALGHGDLVWKETREDGRTVCMCAIDDGHLELIELKTGSFALFHVISDDDWEELGAGTKKLMMKKARAYVEERSLEPKPEPDVKPEPAAEKAEGTDEAPASDDEKTRAAMGSLDSILAGVAEGL